jgi:mxaJ protein
VIEAVAHGDIDVAIVWGPIGGFYAKAHGDKLAVVPAEPDPAAPELPLSFELAMGVRRGDEALRQEVQAALDRREKQVQAILAEYGVPLLPLAAAAVTVANRP